MQVSSGSLQIQTVTSGSPRDAAGYTILIAGEPAGEIGLNATETYSDLAVGIYAIELTDIASNCRLLEPSVLSAEIEADDMTLLTFAVECTAPSGNVQIITESQGDPLDPTGYTIMLDGITLGRLGSNDTTIVSSQYAGELDVGLADLASNCDVTGSNPQAVEVGAGDTVSVNFTVRCDFVLREVAFVSDRDFEGDHEQGWGRYDVYLMTADGSDVLRLTEGVTDVNSASVSPEGVSIAIGWGDQIRIMDLTGSGRVTTPVTGGAFTSVAPAWAPDGERLAFTIDESGWFDLNVYVVDVDGSNLTRLAEGAFPTWSPDGTKIAFNRMDEDGEEIWVMNVDGTDQTNITRSPGHDFWPDWSPDGERILFTSTRGENFDIYVMNADGSEQVNLTKHAAFDGYPQWSSDGARIAFVTNRTGNGEIFTINADGTDPVNLTNHPAEDVAPAW